LNRPNLVNAKTIFVSTLIVIPTLTLIIYLSGVKEHRSLYLNSILSTSILSVMFLIFITVGLYRGWKLKDNIGNLFDKIDRLEKPGSGTADAGGLDLDFFNADGLEGCITSIFAWAIIGVLGTFILWALGTVFWAVTLAIAALLYWIIFRAYRLIFRNSLRCRRDFWKSLRIAIVFTFLYNCWIYIIIFTTHFLDR
jgi:hypothetical protein